LISGTGLTGAHVSVAGPGLTVSNLSSSATLEYAPLASFLRLVTFDRDFERLLPRPSLTLLDGTY